jgi:hypothetical protein
MLQKLMRAQIPEFDGVVAATCGYYSAMRVELDSVDCP